MNLRLERSDIRCSEFEPFAVHPWIVEEFEYLETISPAGRVGFRTLLNRDRNPKRLRRLPVAYEFPDADNEEQKRRRDAAYEAGGRYVGRIS